jgi:hypothetical protein
MTATTSPLTLTSRPETAVRADRRTWSRRTSFWLAVATQVLVLAASNFPTPLFPIYAGRYHFGAATVTLLFAAYVAALIPAMLTLGRITDRVGRRPALGRRHGDHRGQFDRVRRGAQRWMALRGRDHLRRRRRARDVGDDGDDP